jgi:hypothetical protein
MSGVHSGGLGPRRCDGEFAALEAADDGTLP